MKEWLESWQAVAALMAAVVGGTLWIATSIGDLRLEVAEVRLEIHALETRIEGRLSAVEAKLDLLIKAMDIQAGDDQ